MSAAETGGNDAPPLSKLSEPLASALAAAAARIEAAEQHILAGGIPALADLPDDIGRLCEQAASLAPDQQRAARPLLQKLIGDLDRLHEALLARAPASSSPSPKTP